MNSSDTKNHWEHIYSTKELAEVSWYQPVPVTSLEFVKQFNLKPNAKIIDIGGGDSLLVDHLLALGFIDITVLDISENALRRAQQRLGSKAAKVKWIAEDVANFIPTEKYDFWHDRAVLHFLTDEKDISSYINALKNHVNPHAIVVIGTFSEEGPKKCSGIEIKQYSETSMTDRFKDFFEKIRCINVNHKTPFDTIQNFIFCSFRKIV